MVDAEPAHHSKAGAIHNRETLVTPGTPDLPGNLQICQTNSLDDRNPGSQTVPKSLRGVALKFVME